ncbi:MAG: hypothetical protein K0S71_299 [Clostridia bacterium]|jgi:dephospho-CoA kinase|nr:hypothetical protein [Clostridia bacterium]
MKIALVGKMRSGKDTVGNYLIENYGFRRFAFAEGIRNILNEYFPEKVAEGKPRAMYQGIGQYFRSFEPNVWINYTDRSISDYLKENQYGNVIITDTRQLNEYTYLKDNGYIVVKVAVTREDQIKRIVENGDIFNPADLEHETEEQAEAMLYDYQISNNGTLEELYQKIESVLYLVRAEANYHA